LNSCKEEDIPVQPEIKIQVVKIEDSIVIIHLQIEINQYKIKEQVLM
jgi:anti-anti-sigma regulatory factor